MTLWTRSPLSHDKLCTERNAVICARDAAAELDADRRRVQQTTIDQERNEGIELNDDGSKKKDEPQKTQIRAES